MEEHKVEDQKIEERRAMQEKLERCRKIRNEIHRLLLPLVNSISMELKTKGFRKNGKVDLYLRMAGYYSEERKS